MSPRTSHLLNTIHSILGVWDRVRCTDTMGGGQALDLSVDSVFLHFFFLNFILMVYSLI